MTNIFRPVTVDSKEELIDMVQERNLLTNYRTEELIEALYKQGHIEKFETGASTILVIPKEVIA